MTPVGCLVFGHRPAFRAEGRTMRWECERGCGEGGGAKSYDTAAEAERFAAAFETAGSRGTRRTPPPRTPAL